MLIQVQFSHAIDIRQDAVQLAALEVQRAYLFQHAHNGLDRAAVGSQSSVLALQIADEIENRSHLVGRQYLNLSHQSVGQFFLGSLHTNLRGAIIARNQPQQKARPSAPPRPLRWFIPVSWLRNGSIWWRRPCSRRRWGCG